MDPFAEALLLEHSRWKYTDEEERAIEAAAGELQVQRCEKTIEFRCPKCGQTWTLTRRADGKVYGGNVVTLLVHIDKCRKKPQVQRWDSSS